MRRTPFLLLIALALSASASYADPTGDTRHAIQAAYNQMNAAAANKDVNGSVAYYTPDYTATDIHGKVTNVAQGRQAAQTLFAQAQSVSGKTTVTSLTLNNPGQATVLERGHLVMDLAVTAQTGGPVSVVLETTSRDLWVKLAKGWRMKREQVLTETFTMNGKPFPVP